jgi:hypothetical protein
MSISRGELVQAALWFNAEHAQEKDSAKLAITVMLKKFAAGSGCILGPVEWSEIDDRRVPAPPKHFMGTPKCLLGSAEILALVPCSTFTDQLGEDDLAALRAATRRNSPNHLSDEECDDIINELGPETAGRWSN